MSPYTTAAIREERGTAAAAAAIVAGEGRGMRSSADATDPENDTSSEDTSDDAYMVGRCRFNPLLKAPDCSA